MLLHFAFSGKPDVAALCAFLFFLAWIPAVYYVALRFTKALPPG